MKNEAIAATVASGAAVSAPGAGTTVSSLGVLPAGTYRVHVTVLNAGTAETTTAGLANMILRKGASVIGNLPVTAQPVRQVFERITVDGTQSIQVAASAAAIAGSMYVASLSAVRVSS